MYSLKPLALGAAVLLLLTACAPGQAPEVSPAPEPESPSSVSAPAPEPEAEPEPSQPEISESEPESEPEPAPPEEPSSDPNGRQENPDTTTMNPDTAFAPDEQPPVSVPVDTRYLLREYLKTVLTDEEYTSFYVTEKDGLGILTPNVERVKEAVAAYDGPPAVEVEYCETVITKARQDAAREAYRKLHKSLMDTSDPLIANSGVNGLPDDPNPGKIHIEIHQMHPALQEFLDTSGYGDCFVVTVTGADLPIVNPDT